MMLKAIHAQESKEAARTKADAVAEKLREMKLSQAAHKVEEGIEETLTYMDYPTKHWNRIRTNNTTERVNWENLKPCFLRSLLICLIIRCSPGLAPYHGPGTVAHAILLYSSGV